MNVICLISLTTSAHQCRLANLLTLLSDMFPKNAVGSVLGIGGMFEAVGEMLIATANGYLLDKKGSYVPLFIIASIYYVFAFLIIQVLAPK